MGLIMDWLILDWLILVLVTPLIVVVVVLLYGFVGCGFDEPGSGPSAKDTAPSNLTATAIGTDTIELVWQDNSGGVATSFKVERFEPNPPPSVGGNFNVIESHASSPFSDGLRNDGTDFTYQVRAVLAGVTYDSDPSIPAATATTHPNPPSNLVLTPQDVDQISLDWDHSSESNKTIVFLVEHRPTAGGIWNPLPVRPTRPSGKVVHITYPHKDPLLLTPGSEHEYRVTAIVMDGFDDSKPVKEVPSTPATAPPAKTWAVAFFKGVLTTNQPPGTELKGYCLVERISKTLLDASGTKQVRITLRGPSAGQLTINRIYISQPARPGEDPSNLNPDRWDSRPLTIAGLSKPGGLTKVWDIDDTPGKLPVKLPVIPSVVPDNTFTILGPIDYVLDRTQDLLIAFDIDNTAGQGNVRYSLLPGTGTESYQKAPPAPPPPPAPAVPTAQAKVANRSPAPGLPLPGFTTVLDKLYLVEKIEVL